MEIENSVKAGNEKNGYICILLKGDSLNQGKQDKIWIPVGFLRNLGEMCVVGGLDVFFEVYMYVQYCGAWILELAFMEFVIAGSRIGRMGCAFFDPEFESGAFKNVSPIICRCIISASSRKRIEQLLPQPRTYLLQ